MMKPNSKSSCSCVFNNLSFVGSIQYGAFEIGSVLGTSSIVKSISQVGGNPGKSSGNTSGKSPTFSGVSYTTSVTLAKNV